MWATFRHARASGCWCLARGALWGLVCLAATWPAAAAAGRTAALTRATGSGADKAAAQVGYAVRAWLSASDGHEVVDLESNLGNPDKARAVRTRDAAEALLVRGRAAYEALDLDGAVQNLSGALARYEKLAAYLDDLKKVGETLMLLGATHILRGEEKLGVRRLEQAVGILPDVEPDPRVFNPAMRKIFNEKVVAPAARPTGSVTITSAPSYSEVWVDGRFRGISPLTLEGLGEGQHFLRLRHDGIRPWGKTLNISAAKADTESALLSASTQADAFDQGLDQVIRHLPRPGKEDGSRISDGAVARLAELCRADELLITQVKLGGERVVMWSYLISVPDQKLIKSMEHLFAYDSPLSNYESEVADFLQRDMGIAHAAPVDVVSAQEEIRPVTKDRRASDDAGLTHAGQARCAFDSDCAAFKTAVVASTMITGGVAVGVGGLFYYFAKKAHDDFQVTPQVDPKSRALVSRGKGFALGGDILIGVGAGLLVAGTLTWVLWEPQPSESDVIDPAPRKRTRLEVSPAPGGLTMSLSGSF